jgi:hypothetical protein
VAKNKPRIRFCWHCGNKLWGNHHIEAIVDGHSRVLHKQCFKNLEEECPGSTKEVARG